MGHEILKHIELNTLSVTCGILIIKDNLLLASVNDSNLAKA